MIRTVVRLGDALCNRRRTVDVPGDYARGMTPADPPALPLADRPPRERADAARNRALLLDTAARLVAEHGAAQVTMDEVAAAAGVGKGTVFRRFGDRAGLMQALLDHAERSLQQAVLAGPPPLGPGAPPADRLRAFGGAVIAHRVRYRDLYLAAELPPARRYVENPPHDLLLRHVHGLLRAAGADGDVDVLAPALLATLDTALLVHLNGRREIPVARLAAAWERLVDGVLTGPGPGAAGP